MNRTGNRKLIEPPGLTGPDTPGLKRQPEPAPTPGQQGLVLAALLIGVLLLGIQLWLLSVALELYLAGGAHQVWVIPLVSGLIFLGGLLTLWIFRRHHRF